MNTGKICASDEASRKALHLERHDDDETYRSPETLRLARSIGEVPSQRPDYVLALKDNHPKLSKAVSDFFLQRLEQEDFQQYGCRQVQSEEKARGKVETRYYMIAPIPDSLRTLTKSWKGIKSIGQAITVTRSKDGTETSEVRHYISSIEPKLR